MDKEKRKTLRRRIGFYLLWVFGFVAGKIPLACNYAFGTFVGYLGYYVLARHRRVAFKSIQRAFPKKSHNERKRIVKGSFVFMGQTSLELLHFLKNPERLSGIRVEGKEHLDAALSHKKGVVMFSGHLGNFPLAPFKLLHLGYPAHIMARPMRDEKTGDYIHGERLKAGFKIILSYPRKRCVEETMKALRNNEIVIIQMDQNFGTGGVWVKFFGKLAATPVGAIVFALRTQAPLVPMYIVREGWGKHCIKIFPAFDLERGATRDETVLLTTVKCTQIIEKWICDAPGQWSWIHRRWKSKPSSSVMQAPYKVQKD